MSDEKLEQQVASREEGGAPAPKKKRTKRLAIAGVIVVVLVAVGAGMMVWHSFLRVV